jgi:hypothetical protein
MERKVKLVVAEVIGRCRCNVELTGEMNVLTTVSFMRRITQITVVTRLLVGRPEKNGSTPSRGRILTSPLYTEPLCQGLK